MEVYNNHKVTTISWEKDKARANYLEPIAKVHNELRPVKQGPDKRNEFATTFQENRQTLKNLLNEGLTLSCTAGYLQGSCSGGHKFLKAVFCGKEWCENCGQDGSPVHLRRLGRWIPKAEQMNGLGYYVITMPKEIRAFYMDRNKLSEFRKYITRKLQREGYNRGLVRWHWFGDCRHCKAHGCRYCRNTGMSNQWHPHLNIIVDGGYISKKIFEAQSEKFKAELISYFKKHTGSEVNEVVFHYSYVKGSDNKKRMHLLKYVTRSTHRNYNKQIAELLKGYRTTSTWGKWKFKKVVKTEESELVNITNNVCPCCAEKITWHCGQYVTDQITGQTKYKREILRLHQVGDISKMKHIEAGYYLLQP